MTRSQPIGIFDSGIGGLTIARAIVDAMPEENILYFGDTAHFPYGDKSPEAIQAYALEITDRLLASQCKLILIACYSATSAASDQIRAHVAGRAIVLDVMDPVIQLLAEAPPQHKVGLIGTRHTVRSGIYRQRLETLCPNLLLSCQATPLLASVIEEFGNHRITDCLLEEYLSYPQFDGIESLILACTHYPLVKDKIAAFFKGKVNVIDPSVAVANAARQQLTDKGLRQLDGTGTRHFYVSDMTDSFAAGARLFFDDPLLLEHSPAGEPHELSASLACRELC